MKPTKPTTENTKPTGKPESKPGQFTKPQHSQQPQQGKPAQGNPSRENYSKKDQKPNW